MSIANAFGGANAPLAANLTISGSLDGLRPKRTGVNGGTYDTQPNDCFLACVTSDATPITINLSGDVIPGTMLVIADVVGAAATHNVTINAPGGGGIHGYGIAGSSVTLNHNYASIILIASIGLTYNVVSYYNS
jgi:hypothetical protein